MKAIAFGNRLSRDFTGPSFIDMPSDARQEILDAINGGLQQLHARAPHDSKITTASIYLPAPSTVSLGVTQGSAEITGHTFTSEDFYRTIRIDGDDIDNQVISETELLHPYTGATSTASATIYSDAATVPEPYDELIGDPRVVETDCELRPFHPPNWQMRSKRRHGEPRYFHVEANARNQNPPAPSVIRFDSLPSQSYRLQAKFTLAPARISFADLLAPGADIPLREEFIELYLLPISRGLLTDSGHWKNPATRASVNKAAEKALSDYQSLVSHTLATPNNTVGTPPGW